MGSEPMASVFTAVLYQLSYEEPFIDWEQANLLSSS